MKKNKTALLIIISIILISVLLYFLPLDSYIGKLPFFSTFYNNTSLEIITQKGKAKIWIDGKEYGETPSTVENLPEGKYLVELEKIEEEESFYQKHSFNIELTRNTSARIDMEIGPDNILHGSILYYTPIRTSTNKGFLTITSNVEEAKIFLDKEFLKTTPITNLDLDDNQYQIKVTANGYEDIEIPVLVRKNYSLNVKTYHYPVPVSFDSLEKTDE